MKPKSRLGSWAIVVALLFTPSIAGLASPGEAADTGAPSIGSAARAEVLGWVAEELSSKYVDPTVAVTMVERLKTRKEAGAYDDLDDVAAFLYAVEQDLRAASADKHVGLWFERPEDAKTEDVDYTPADPAYVEHLRRTNYGYRKLEILPGNIGYLRIDEFAHSGLGGPATVAVMNALGSSDALILDLRWNGGGAGMVGFLCGYFFDEPTHLNDTWERASGAITQTWTPEYVPGPSLSKVPLFILTSRQTFSAAEDFAYALQALGRAKVVGERTKGGGHPVEMVRQSHDRYTVVMMVPDAKSLNPITDTSWEGVGVQPDIAAKAHEALGVAYESAVNDLLSQAIDDKARRRLEWSRLEFHADQHPPELTAQQLTEYAGTYETRRFAVGEDGALLYKRDADSSFPMVAMGDDVFRFEGYDDVRFQFGRDDAGNVDRVIALTPDGPRDVSLRTADTTSVGGS